MRKYYLDNLRSMMILLLFLVHTFMIWNNYGDKFYVWNGDNNILSTLIVLINPWFMSILFVIAGISTKYSLQKRSIKQFIKERIKKLLVPLIFGVVFLVPIMTLYARKFFYQYDGDMLENIKYFFTNVTDLNGYDGGFSPGHLWFILFLFIVSLIGLMITKYLPYDKVKYRISNFNIPSLIGLFILVCLFYYIGNFGGHSIGRSLILYLSGYYIFSNDLIIDKLAKNIKWITPIFIILQAVLAILYYNYSYYGDIMVNFVGWIGILFFLPLGKLYLNKQNKITKYFSTASYSIYILHQPILVVLGYYVLLNISNLTLQVVIIILGSFILTVIAYCAYNILKNLLSKTILNKKVTDIENIVK